jgi:DNA-binding SARP family transcriptional activator
MQFLLLGSTEVINSAREPVTPTAYKVRSLLAYLCLQAGQAVSSDQLKEVLWQDDRPRTSQTSLHVHISRLRKYLERVGAFSVTLDTIPSGYILQCDQNILDVSAFHDLARTARHEEARGAKGEAVEVINDSLSLWRGRAVFDLRECSAIDRMARRLDEERILIQEKRLELNLGLGRVNQVILDLYDLVASHPLRENLYLMLMVALYRGGRTAEALEAYRTIRETLRDELGMEPSPGLKDIHQAILSRAEWLKGSTASQFVSVS